MSASSSVPEELAFRSVVRPEHHGYSLGRLLSERFTYHSPEEWLALIDAGCVLINERAATREETVKKGDRITYIAKNYQEPPVPTHFEMIWEEEDFIVVGKPADIPVHHTGKIFWNTFTSVLRRALREPELVPMHRLDRDTSGIMLYARSADAAKRFQKNFERIVWRKIYLAAVFADEAQMDFWRRYAREALTVDVPLREQNGQAIRVQMVADWNGGKPCSTRFRFLGEADHWSVDASRRRVALLEAELLSGRKHQIRAHLAHLGTPVVGDPVYSHQGFYYIKRLGAPLTEEDVAVLGSRTHMLHAWKMQLKLPGWREPRWLESRLFTDDMARVVSAVMS